MKDKGKSIPENHKSEKLLDATEKMLPEVPSSSSVLPCVFSVQSLVFPMTMFNVWELEFSNGDIDTTCINIHSATNLDLIQSNKVSPPT